MRRLFQRCSATECGTRAPSPKWKERCGLQMYLAREETPINDFLRRLSKLTIEKLLLLAGWPRDSGRILLGHGHHVPSSIRPRLLLLDVAGLWLEVACQPPGGEEVGDGAGERGRNPDRGGGKGSLSETENSSKVSSNFTLRTKNHNIRTMATTPWTSWWAACGSPQASRSSSTRGSSPPTPPSHQSGFQTAVSTGTNKPSK